MRTITFFSTRLPILAALGLLGACANQPTETELTFGDSVREMIRAQTYDPSTLSNPSSSPVDRTDGPLLEGVLESYRSGDSGEASSSPSEVLINVGGGR